MLQYEREDNTNVTLLYYWLKSGDTDDVNYRTSPFLCSSSPSCWSIAFVRLLRSPTAFIARCPVASSCVRSSVAEWLVVQSSMTFTKLFRATGRKTWLGVRRDKTHLLVFNMTISTFKQGIDIIALLVYPRNHDSEKLFVNNPFHFVLRILFV